MTAARVAITGATGRVGRVITAWFAEHGYHVLAIDRSAGPAPARVQLRDVDLASPDAVAAAVKDTDAVVHLAAMNNPDVAPPQVVFANNTQATLGVLTGAAQAGVPRVVYASSGASYGLSYSPSPVSPSYLPIDEDHPQRPADPYGLSKLVDELVAAAVHRQHGMTVIGLRFPFVHSLAELRRHARTLEHRPELGARQLWAYLEVTDLARAIDKAVGVAGVDCEVFCLAAADTLATTPTAELVRAHHPMSELRSPLFGHAGLWDAAKAERLLDWHPEVTWREGET